MPTEYQVQKLDSILTPEQLDGVLDIIQVYADDGVARMRELKRYLNGFSKELEHRGILADYLAYAIEYQARSITRQDVANVERN